MEDTPEQNALQWPAFVSMRIREVLALDLRRMRHEAKLSQEALASFADLDRTYISALERSVYAATVAVLERLTEVLGVEAADLLQRREASRTIARQTARKPV